MRTIIIGGVYLLFLIAAYAPQYYEYFNRPVPDLLTIIGVSFLVLLSIFCLVCLIILLYVAFKK